MDAARDALPDDITALKEALIIERAKGLEVAAELAVARAKASEDVALIAQQKLRIAKLERQVYGQRSERSARLIDQLALAFEELEAGATEDELAAETAVAKTTSVREFTRRRPERNAFPDHLPRERVVIDPPTACECCGGNRLRKLGEDGTRELPLPRLREDHASAGAVPCHREGMGGTQPPGHDHVREVRSASAPEPPGRALRSGRRADRVVDHGRRRGVGLRGARSSPAPCGKPCHGGRAPACG